MNTKSARVALVLDYVKRVNVVLRVHSNTVATQSARELWRDINPGYIGGR